MLVTCTCPNFKNITLNSIRNMRLYRELRLFLNILM